MEQDRCDICKQVITGSYRWQTINGTVYRWHVDCEDRLHIPANIILGEE
jgi:hypothetical protein